MSNGQFFYPNRWARLVLTSAEEIVGDKGIAALLNMAKIAEFINNYPPNDMEKAFSFEQVGQLQQAIWDMNLDRQCNRGHRYPGYPIFYTWVY